MWDKKKYWRDDLYHYEEPPFENGDSFDVECRRSNPDGLGLYFQIRTADGFNLERKANYARNVTITRKKRNEGEAFRYTIKDSRARQRKDGGLDCTLVGMKDDGVFLTYRLPNGEYVTRLLGYALNTDSRHWVNFGYAVEQIFLSVHCIFAKFEAEESEDDYYGYLYA